MTVERAADDLLLTCRACGPVQVRPANAVLHESRSHGFRLLQATCPTCGEVMVTAAPDRLALAVAAQVQVRELLPHRPVLCEADLESFCRDLADDARLGRFLDDEHWSQEDGHR